MDNTCNFGYLNVQYCNIKKNDENAVINFCQLISEDQYFMAVRTNFKQNDKYFWSDDFIIRYKYNVFYN